MYNIHMEIWASNGKLCKINEYRMRCQLGMESEQSLEKFENFEKFVNMIGYKFDELEAITESEMENMMESGLENLMRK